MGGSRVQKTLKNAKTSLVFYVLLLITTFLSRSVFIKCLGEDFVGLTSAMMNIMGFLNLAEMGFSSVVAFALYKPIYEKDQSGINEIVSVFAYIYNRIGWIILLCGLALVYFLPEFFKDSGFENRVIWATFFTYLITTLLGFFVNYKETLLAADQNNFIKVRLFNIVKISKVVVQVLCLLYLDGGLYIWLLLEFSFLSVYSLVINLKIKKLYPDLVSSVKSGRELSRRYGFIYTKAKQAFFHKFSATVLQQVTGILIYVFSNLATVTKYTNYTLITASLYTLLSSIFDSTNAAVGNLVAEKDSKKILRVFWELQVSRYWIATCMVYVTYTTVDLFIAVWLDKSFVLPEDIKIVLMLNLFIMLTRKTNDEFISAVGLFKDVWAPITEAVINIGVSVAAGSYLGIVGIPLGTLLSLLLIIGIWKPVFLYSEFMPQSLGQYFLRIFKYLFISFSSIVFVEQIPLHVLPIDNPYYVFINMAAQRTLEVFLMSGLIYFALAAEMRSFLKRFKRR